MYEVLERLGPWAVLVALILIAIGFALWRFVLGPSYATIGWRPLAFGYLVFVVVLFANLATFGRGFSGFYRISDFFLYALTVTSLALAPIAARSVRKGFQGYPMVKAFLAFDIVITAFFFLATYFVFLISPWTSAFFFGVINSVDRRERQMTLDKHNQRRLHLEDDVNQDRL